MTSITANKQEYHDLRQDLADLLEKGRLQAVQAVSEIANRTYWQVGKRLNTVSALADSGSSSAFITSLASDLGVSPSLLYHALRFFRTYPRGLPKEPDAAKLGFGSHVLLLPIKDESERLYYIGRAVAEGWSRSKLRRAVKSGLFARESGQTLDAPAATLDRPLPGLHRYVGIIEKIVDGDTLDVRIDLGFDVWRLERIRLRGVDTPEMDTAEGKAAREFVVQALSGVASVAFKTYKTDIYARYIADVFYDPAAEDKDELIERGRFLNQELLDAGQALPMN
ncbi:MAG TPA: DUF1016 N-terminal domain-containing protein [Myxococcota bacterium]|nr:DUF1016 N-terminal domain-containing protein [Myxococcota bacterium]